ncbi:hypothetical protein F5141DRAFT_1147277 [Pisolithus sp. B1]|nr:hypothetical protein F5141DRAFT_1147277 [Pisolithus sp. B1]
MIYASETTASYPSLRYTASVSGTLAPQRETWLAHSKNVHAYADTHWKAYELSPEMMHSPIGQPPSKAFSKSRGLKIESGRIIRNDSRNLSASNPACSHFHHRRPAARLSLGSSWSNGPRYSCLEVNAHSHGGADTYGDRRCEGSATTRRVQLQ